MSDVYTTTHGPSPFTLSAERIKVKHGNSQHDSSPLATCVLKEGIGPAYYRLSVLALFSFANSNTGVV